MTVEQKVALVTGASRGIGAAIADDLGASQSALGQDEIEKALAELRSAFGI